MAGIIISAIDINKVVSCKCRLFVSVVLGRLGGGGELGFVRSGLVTGGSKHKKGSNERLFILTRTHRVQI